MSVYEQIYDQINDEEFEDELNSVKKLSENGVLRRLYRVLSMPTDELEIDPSKQLNLEVNCTVCINEREEEETKKGNQDNEEAKQMSLREKIVAWF